MSEGEQISGSFSSANKHVNGMLS